MTSCYNIEQAEHQAQPADPQLRCDPVVENARRSCPLFSQMGPSGERGGLRPTRMPRPGN